MIIYYDLAPEPHILLFKREKDYQQKVSGGIYESFAKERTTGKPLQCCLYNDIRGNTTSPLQYPNGKPDNVEA
ncbi:hypothetical protein BC936DRAFT_146419 [Jimgerdemannia flammicorona]|uniref:Uncharacterized protein n=1 Tax=Jimgerdemannia flammicorona TaxID=994334 RepID=A0A433D8E4_9FUNG|nr:hypothetical protein BC936DRAFT_146419 [Jimgerdemannia flammicorona]